MIFVIKETKNCLVSCLWRMLEIVTDHVLELRWPGLGPSKKSAHLKKKKKFNKEQFLIDPSRKDSNNGFIF